MADSLPEPGPVEWPAAAPTGAGTGPGDGPARSSEVVALALAAGAGTRLHPLTFERPKPLCPVGGIALLDWALAWVAPLVEDVVVNVHHGADALLTHLRPRLAALVEDDGAEAVQRPEVVESPWRLLGSIEQEQALGTAGAVGRIRPWLDGRSVLVVNTDSWCAEPPGGPSPFGALLDGWDGERVRVLCHGADVLGPRVGVLGSLVPNHLVPRLEARPSGLWEALWRDELAAGRLETVRYDGTFVDAGTPPGYLRANLAARPLFGADGDRSVVGYGALVSGACRASVVGSDAVVDGAIDESVVWDGAVVEAAERLHRAIRTTAGRTVLVR